VKLEDGCYYRISIGVTFIVLDASKGIVQYVESGDISDYNWSNKLYNEHIIAKLSSLEVELL
jgi:hypothetical protein